MTIYKYECTHEQCDKLAVGIRKCKSCGMVIITDRGVVLTSEQWINADW